MKALPLAVLGMLAATSAVLGQEPSDEHPQPARLVVGQASAVSPSASFVDLEQRVAPGDEIFVTDRDGRETAGRLLRLSSAEIVALAGTEERTFGPVAVARIEKRDPLWNGALIGAVPFALVGMAAAGSSCSPHCASSVAVTGSVFAGIGAGVGALIDRQIRGYAAVYGPSLASPHAIDQGVPVRSLGELWTKVRQGDTIRVLAQSDEVTGKFIRASATSISVLVGGQIREMPASDVRTVARRGNRYRLGALVGAGLIGVVFVSSCASSDNHCSSGDLLFGAALGGMLGALYGAGIGALIPRHAVVFNAATPRTVRVEPIIAPRRSGIALSLRF